MARIQFADFRTKFIGENTADNRADTPLVTAKETGTLLERLQRVQEALAVKGTQTGTASAGSVLSLIDPSLASLPANFSNGQLLVITSGQNAGLARTIYNFNPIGSEIKVSPAFPYGISAGDTYTILPRSDFASILIGTNDDDNVADTSLVLPNADGSLVERLEYLQNLLVSLPLVAENTLQEQPDVGFNIMASPTGVTVVDLSSADTRYVLRDLTVQFALSPGAETVTAQLIKLVNDDEVVVDTYEVSQHNYEDAHNLMMMFGLPYVAGDLIKVKFTSSAGFHSIQGQYSHAKTA